MWAFSCSKTMPRSLVKAIHFFFLQLDECSVRRRLKLLLASGLKPFWYVDARYAEILHSLGCISVSFFDLDYTRCCVRRS